MKFVCVLFYWTLNINIGMNVIPEHSVQRLVQARLGKDWMQERKTTLQQRIHILAIYLCIQEPPAFSLVLWKCVTLATSLHRHICKLVWPCQNNGKLYLRKQINCPINDETHLLVAAVGPYLHFKQ